MVCPLCGSKNQRELRFCVTCGHLLQQAEAPPSPQAMPEALAPPAEPVPIVPIAPARVVEVGTLAPSTQRLCPRCRGGSESTAQFCRFCGASLSEAREVELVRAPPVAHEAPVPIRPSAAEAPTPRDSRRPSRATAATPASESPALDVTSTIRSSQPPPASISMTATVDLPVSPLAPRPAWEDGPPRAAQETGRRARLILVARDGGEGPKYDVGEATDIGRTEGHVIISDDRYLSPRHARIAQRTDGYYLRDLGSTNGVFLRIPFSSGKAASSTRETRQGADMHSEQKLSEVEEVEQPLEDQDLFLVGQQVLRFEVVKDAEEGFGPASANGTLLFGTPAAPRFGRLSQRTVEGVVRDVFHLRKAETVIGRESGDVVFTDDPFLSRRHAVVRVHGTPGDSASPRRFTLADLGSSNGTFLQIRREIRLRDGDHFRIGQQLFRFDLDAAQADA